MCRAGASWVQEEILAKNLSPTLRVYAVWLPMVWSDTRRAWESSVLADPRVIHFWDEQRTTGQWFAEHTAVSPWLQGYRGVAWDMYYLYGPEARWDLTPSPLMSKGRPIYHQRLALQRSILPLLED
jgi:hypothetical protein